MSGIEVGSRWRRRACGTHVRVVFRDRDTITVRHTGPEGTTRSTSAAAFLELYEWLPRGPVLEPKALRWLRDASRQRRAHRARARAALAAYLAEPTTANALRLMQAQEASRGSRIHARRLHEQWERAQQVMRDVNGIGPPRCLREETA